MMSKNETSQFIIDNSSLVNNFVIFQTENGKVNIDVFFKDETIWLTQKLIAELFEKGRSTISEHLKKIFESGELDENVVCRYFRHTTQHGAIEGKTQEKEVKYYNLRAITAVGYRVNSHRAKNHRVMNMKDWEAFLVQFLELTDYPILKNLGKVSMLEAKIKAEGEYEKYRIIQDRNYISDFDKEIKKLLPKEKNNE